MGIEVRSTKNFVNDTGVKIVAYADAGAGKTHAIATLPDPIIISCERGLATLRKFDLPYIEVATMPQMMDAVKYISSSNEMKTRQSVAFDSFTDLAEICLRDEMGKTTNGQKAYGEMANKMIDLCRFLKTFNKHVYITAQLGTMKDELTQIIKYAPSAPGRQLSDELRYQFDNLFYLFRGEHPETKEPVRMFRTDGNEQFAGKNRSAGALNLWEPQDLTAIINKLKV